MKIYVTKPFLPPLSKFLPYIEEIWDSRVLTNNGKFHNLLELELKNYLNVKNISLYSNATLGLIASLKVLRIRGEVITTPYSFVATSSAILTANCKPVYVDVTNQTGNIDPKKIISAITDKTRAILAVHCYGNPCDYDQINNIANKYNLKVIYDACHAFGVKHNNQSILNQGDISIVSFHATKIFNTLEGACIVCNSKELKDKIDKFKNFGILDEENVHSIGINAKLNEVQSALGLLQIKYIDKIIQKRKVINDLYIDSLKSCKDISFIKFSLSTEQNYSYFPILLKNRLIRDHLYDKLKQNNIITRKYFYPIITKFKPYTKFSNNINLKNAEKFSERVLCLPLYPDLKTYQVKHIIKLILKILK